MILDKFVYIIWPQLTKTDNSRRKIKKHSIAFHIFTSQHFPFSEFPF